MRSVLGFALVEVLELSGQNTLVYIYLSERINIYTREMVTQYHQWIDMY